MTVYFLGGGNMAAAVIGGLQRTGSGEAVFVANRGEEKRRTLETQYGVQTGEKLPETLGADDVLVLAVKPQDMQAACSGVNTGGALVLSLAAGLSVNTLSRYLGGTRRIVRVMPNTPAQIGQGVSGLFAAEGAHAADRARAEQIMSGSGMVLWLDDEAQMHAVTAVSGSGSAYVFYLMNALQQAAEQFGFDADQARRLSLATFKGAAALAEQTGEPFAQLQDKVTSKGGTTFAALETFRRYLIAENLQRGAEAAAARSQELAAQFE